MGVCQMNLLTKQRNANKKLLNCSGGLRPPIGALQFDLSGLRILQAQQAFDMH
jgi:hypothetical protein